MGFFTKLYAFKVISSYTHYNPSFIFRLSLTGVAWSLKSLCKRHAYFIDYLVGTVFNKEFMFYTPFGKFSLSSPSLWLYLHPLYESSVRKVIRQNFNRYASLTDKIFLDIGANMGKYSIYLALQGYSVFSFEPSPKTLKILRRNVALNNLSKKVKIIPYALSDRNSTSEFQFFPYASGLSRIVSSHDNIAGYTERILVSTRKLDDILSAYSIPINNIKLVKIDVEGHEYELLKGAKRTLRKLRDVDIILEIWSFSPKKDKVINLMKRLGYSFRQLDTDNYHFWK